VLVKASRAQLRYGAVMRMNRNGVPSFKTVLQAFDTRVANLPGVKVPRGAVGKAEDVTSIIARLYANRRRLNRRQRAVLNRVLARPRQSAVVGAGPAQNPVLQQWTADLAEAGRRLRAHGLELPSRLVGGIKPYPDPKEGSVWGWADPSLISLLGTCRVYLTPTGVAAAPELRRATAIHELVHCAQYQAVDDMAMFDRVPQWVIEGYASWAAGAVYREWTGSSAPQNRNRWLSWLDESNVDLFKRDYTAIGFWGLLEHEGANPWALLRPVMKSGSRAYETAVSGIESGVGLNWGPTVATQPAAAPRWHLASGDNPFTRPFHESDLSNERSYSAAVQPRSGWAVQLNVSSDLVVLRTDPGTKGFFRPAGDFDRELSGEQVYCALPGGCVCNGEPLEYPQIARGAALLGYSAGQGSGGVVVKGEALGSHCTRMNPPDDEPLPEIRGLAVFEMAGGQGLADVLVQFPTGSCRVGRSGFSVTARADGYTLRATIRNFSGFAHNEGIYPVQYRGGDPRFVISGPMGRYGNRFLPPGAQAPGGGVMGFDGNGRLFGIGMYPVFNPAGDRGVAVLGGLRCRYPRRRA
jgi:hypothetical protein